MLCSQVLQTLNELPPVSTPIVGSLSSRIGNGALKVAA